MTDAPTKSPVRLFVGIMLGAAVGLIAISLWQIANDEGSPFWVALGASMLACAAAVISSRTKKK